MTGRKSAPKVVGRPSFEGVGPLLLEKRAAVADTLLRALHTAYKNPRTSGAVIGAAIGAAMSPKGEDGRETARNTIGSLVGGAMGGAIVGDAVARVANPNDSLVHTIFDQNALSTGRLRPAAPLRALISTTVSVGQASPSAARAVISAFAPSPAPPESLVGLLGDKHRYSDKDLFKKYKETSDRGELSSELDKKFVGALRDLYRHGDKAKGAPMGAREFLKNNTPLATNLASNFVLSTFLGQSGREAAIRALPAALHAGAAIGKNLRHHILDKGVVVSNREDAKTRASFSDDQLRRLLQGLGVEQVREHVIK